MEKVAVLGVGMHPFGKFPGKSLKDLARVAVWNAMNDAGVSPKDLQIIYVGNSLAGLLTGQESVRGQVVLRDAGIGGLPVVNVENAGASGSTAFREAWLAVASGLYEVALALGVEKLSCGNTMRTVAALATAMDVEYEALFGIQFTAFYAMDVEPYMKQWGVTERHLAQVVVKNSKNAALNPNSTVKRPLRLEEVLQSPPVVPPLRRRMCAGNGDGAAAAVVGSLQWAKRWGRGPLVTVEASALKSGMYRAVDEDLPSTSHLAALEAYEMAGIGPQDLDVVEVHDAIAPAELVHCEDLGLCREGEALRLLEERRTEIGGNIPVNPSGGLVGKGHPTGATGLAQIAEVVWQLRGEADARQVTGARFGLTQNEGGRVDGDAACAAIHIFRRAD